MILIDYSGWPACTVVLSVVECVMCINNYHDHIQDKSNKGNY